jgi:putative addiction module component (TIGR02574 family)
MLGGCIALQVSRPDLGVPPASKNLEAAISHAYSFPMPILTSGEISRQSAPERLALIGELWDSLGDAEMPTSSAQHLELKRRLASFDHDQPQAMSWEQLKAELAARTA